MLYYADYNRFSDLFSDYLNTITHFNLKLFIIVGNTRHPASFKILISKVQDFGNFELSLMYTFSAVRSTVSEQ